MPNFKRFSFFECLYLDLYRQWNLTARNSEKNPSILKLCLIFFSPRFAPVLIYRLAYFFKHINLGPIAKIISTLNFILFGIEISANCKIGPGLFFPHTHGIVIGAWEIGKNATIYQGATIGAKVLDFTYAKSARPIIGDDVTVGSGAKILGGIKMGNNVVIGANAVVLKDVEENMTAIGVPAKSVQLDKYD